MLSKIKLKATRVLVENDMKRIYGGGAYVGGDGICAWSPYDNPAGGISGCTKSATRAEAGAGPNGWWCCNCTEAKTACGSLLS